MIRLSLLLAIFALQTFAKPITVSGRLDHIAIDMLDGSHKHEWFLADGSNLYQLLDVEKDCGFEAKNALIEGDLDEEKNSIKVLKCKILEGGIFAEASGGRILHVIADFNDGYKASDIVSPRDISEMFFGSKPGSFNNWIQVASYGKIKFTSEGMKDIFHVNMGIPRTCSFYGIHRAADKVLIEKGIDLSVYKHRAYIVDTSCGWAGIAQVGGSISLYKDTYAKRPFLWAHELGHNFGFGHSNTPGSAYADKSGVMGSPWSLVGYNAPHVLYGGWLEDVDGYVEDVDGDEILELKAFNHKPMDDDLPSILRVEGSSGKIYTISYRKKLPGSMESIYKMNDAYVGVNIHLSGRTTVLYKVLKSQDEKFDIDGITVSVLKLENTKVTLRVRDGSKPPEPDCKGNRLKIRYNKRRAVIEKEGDVDYIVGTIYNTEKFCRMQAKMRVPQSKYFKAEPIPQTFRLDGEDSFKFRIKITYVKKRKGRDRWFKHAIHINGKKVGSRYAIRVK